MYSQFHREEKAWSSSFLFSFNTHVLYNQNPVFRQLQSCRTAPLNILIVIGVQAALGRRPAAEWSLAM
jgi:hypothetical protein